MHASHQAALFALLLGAAMPLYAQLEAEAAPVDAPVTAEAPVAPEAAATVEATVAVDAPAEDAPAEESSEAPKSRFVEEIIVTAQKREENLQDVPISVQAFSADALDARGIDDPKALQLATPGLQYNLFAGYSLIYIRGVGTDAFIPSADASVATYIDNVYYPFGHSLASSFGAIERVEVLKGPQGTLFGRNSTGGAINIVSKRPGNFAETSIQVSRASYEQWNTRAYTNLPVTDTFAVAISGIYNSEDNYYEQAADSPMSELPTEVTKGFRLKAGWTPLEDLEVTLSATNLEVDGAMSMMLPASDVKPLGLVTGVRQEKDFESGTDAPIYIATRAKIYSGDVKYSTPWFDTRVIVAKQDITSPALADYDGSRAPLFTFESIGQFADVKTGELQILSNAETPFAERFNWIAGLYMIDSSAGYDPLYFSAAPGAIGYLSNPVTGPLAGLVSPLVNGLLGIPGIPSLTSLVNNGVTLGLEGVLDTESTATFFQGTFNISDELALTLGGRYQTETRKLVKSNVNLVLDASTGDAGTLLIPYPQQEEDTSNFSPKVVLDYKFMGEQMVYASWSKGFKSGTFNIINIYTPTQYIEPEEVTAYELGLKSTFLGGALRVNTAIFQNEIDNLQVQTISLTSGGAVKFETAGGARIRGADFDITWLVAPDALPGLVLTAAGAYLDGEYTSYREGSGFDEESGLYFDGTIFRNRDFTGNEVVRTPTFSGNAGFGYTFDFDDSSLEVAGDVYYNDGFFYSAQNTKTASEDAYTLLNARVSYFYTPWGLRVTAFGKNLTDAKYHYVRQELDFGTAGLLAPPATYGVRVNWEF